MTYCPVQSDINRHCDQPSAYPFECIWCGGEVSEDDEIDEYSEGHAGCRLCGLCLDPVGQKPTRHYRERTREGLSQNRLAHLACAVSIVADCPGTHIEILPERYKRTCGAGNVGLDFLPEIKRRLGSVRILKSLFS